MSEFDQYAQSYRTLHDASVRFSGESGEYFADYKLAYLAGRWSPQPGDRILDYGCGIGMLTGRLAAQFPGCEVVGYDPSRESLVQANSRVAHLPNVQLTGELGSVQGDCAWVVCANVLHHVLPQERSAVVADMVKCLRPGGSLVIFEHNPLNPLTRRAVAACPFDEGVVLLPRSETISLMMSAGVRGARARYIVFFPSVLRALRSLEPHLAWLPLGAQYSAEGRASG